MPVLWSQLTGGNWQKWKRVFLTCPCHKIYRDEAVGLTKKLQKYLKNYDICENVKFGAISWKFDILSITAYACVKGHLEPTHLKSSPLFTFSTKSLGQDSPSVHLFSKTIGSRFTTAKIKLGEDSPSWFIHFRSRFTLK